MRDDVLLQLRATPFCRLPFCTHPRLFVSKVGWLFGWEWCGAGLQITGVHSSSHSGIKELESDHRPSLSQKGSFAGDLFHSSLLRVTEQNRAETGSIFNYSKTFLLQAEHWKNPPHLDHLLNETACSVAECAFCVSLPNLLCERQEYKKKFRLTGPFCPWIVCPPLMLLEQQYCSLRLWEILAVRSLQRPKLAGKDKQAHHSVWSCGETKGAETGT